MNSVIINERNFQNKRYHTYSSLIKYQYWYYSVARVPQFVRINDKVKFSVELNYFNERGITWEEVSSRKIPEMRIISMS
jgi:hypothetical protein